MVSSGAMVPENIYENGKPKRDYDNDINERLRSLAQEAGYWDFRKGAHRDGLHGITQYPAMMVPAMQGQILDTICSVIGRQGTLSVTDPFVGSGTTQVESVRRGLHFYGQDLNPYSILISKAKAGPFKVEELEESIERVVSGAKASRIRKIDIDFLNRDKWFETHITKELCKLRNAITPIEDLWVRRVLWVVLGETVRITSNSRTSTFKLHIRPIKELLKRNLNTIEIFQGIALDVLKKIASEVELLSTNSLLKNNSYIKNLEIKLGNSAASLPSDNQFDILITSPPYGDGATTVPYGQYSYLPLQWINKADICDRYDDSLLSTTHEIDSRSLGGSRKHALTRVQSVIEMSPSLRNYLADLKNQPKDRVQRVASFFADLEPVITVACNRVRNNGYMIWTVGNRNVGGITQPFDQILSEILENNGCRLVHEIQRSIPSKRMATRNSISTTMREEYILVFKSGGGNVE